MRTEADAQIARVKWLLTLTGQAVRVSGFTTQVIDILAPAMVSVMEAEGVFLAYQSTVDREASAMDADST